jgi:hypothetical protein
MSLDDHDAPVEREPPARPESLAEPASAPAPAPAPAPTPSIRKRLAGLGGVLALVAAVGAWLTPNVQGPICAATGDRLIGCNDVPGELLGTWTGIERCVDSSMAYNCTADSSSEVRVRRGLDEEIVVVSRTNVCTAEWTLESVHDGTISVHTERSVPRQDSGAAPGGAMRGCPVDLSATLSRTGDGTLRFDILSGSQTAPGLPPNLPMFTARLTRQ